MSYVIIGLIIAVFVVVVFFVAKKDAKERDEMVSKLTEEQKNFLKDTEIEFVEKNAWVQDALVAKIVDKGAKFDLRVLWYDKTIENNEYNTITIADAKISKAEQAEHNLKVGDAVKLYMAPEKTTGSVKIVF
ncbi:MAG: hypothetical protein K5888_06810 [Lachnospiraceae bacterium]|nr:hypothetical protein [Lachnospiraceae bacterium]